MLDDVRTYIDGQVGNNREICQQLQSIISDNFADADNKVWHAHPVWFLDGNPIVGYSVLKDGVRLMFWSGADFSEPELRPGTGKFRDASITYQSTDQISADTIKRWLDASRTIQWDYKNIVKNKGKLNKLV